MASQSNLEPIKPDELYDYSVAARRLGYSPRSFREKFITTGAIDVYPAGRRYWIMGEAIIRFVIDEMGKCGNGESNAK